MCFDSFQLYAKKVYHKKEYCTSGFPLIQYVLLFSPDGRSLQALERPAILVQAQIASLSTLV